MRARPYHKRWHGNALNGMRGLTLEERGAYNTLLDLMYDRQGPWPDDERRTCGELDCDPRVWRRVRDSLQKKGKIVVHGGLIYARRVSEELGTSAELPAEVREKFAIATQQLSPTSGEKPKENSASPDEKKRKPDALFHSPESIPPKAPKGPGVTKDDVEAIWATASDVSRKRSGKPALRKALEAAVRDGHPVELVKAGLAAFFASDDATRDGGKFVAGVHRLVKDGRWEGYLPPDAAIPPQGALPLDQPTTYANSPWPSRLRAFARNAYWNRLDWGPPPGRPGCEAPADLQREFGVEPAKLQPIDRTRAA